MKRLLIVDDDLDHRLVLRTMFESKGYWCEEAENGVEALLKLEKGKISLVLTDLQMPEMNGLQLIERMRASYVLKSIPTILMTSQSMADMPFEAFTLGIQAVVFKPYDFIKLLEEVECAIGKSEMLCSASMG